MATAAKPFNQAIPLVEVHVFFYFGVLGDVHILDEPNLYQISVTRSH